MATLNVVLLALFLIILSNAGAQESRDIDFESDLLSWPRLKRYAGYRTEDGRYRGGLYKRARDEEFERYTCVQNNTDHCLTWTAREGSSGETEQGTCYCRSVNTPYCSTWVCSQVEIERDADCNHGVCTDRVQSENAECTCEETDVDGRYCRFWRCFEDGADGFVEEEEYTCLQEDISGEYCFRWKGDIFSSYELESSVCECVRRSDTYCDYWECKERGLVRCASHSGGWCDLNLSIGLGGGAGVLFILIGVAWEFDTDDVDCKFGPLLICVIFGCLPWTAGVVIWGGVRGLPIVAAMWIATFAVSCFVVYFISPKESEPPSPDIQMTIQHANGDSSPAPSKSRNTDGNTLPHYLN